jgi:hypothetical protein
MKVYASRIEKGKTGEPMVVNNFSRLVPINLFLFSTYISSKTSFTFILCNAVICTINNHQDDVGTMHDKLSFLGAELLKETLPSIINGTNNRITQNESEASFATNISSIYHAWYRHHLGAQFLLLVEK